VFVPLEASFLRARGTCEEADKIPRRSERSRTVPGRHWQRGARERSVAASPIAITARARHTSRPRSQLAPSPITAQTYQTARWRRAERVDLCYSGCSLSGLSAGLHSEQPRDQKGARS
jgi:hypothetical protein